jgi:hypothetical protein
MVIALTVLRNVTAPSDWRHVTHSYFTLDVQAAVSYGENQSPLTSNKTDQKSLCISASSEFASLLH